MKRLRVQLQPGRSPEMNVPVAVAKLRTVTTNARVNEGEEEGQYVNIGFKTADPAMVWAAKRGRGYNTSTGTCPWQSRVRLVYSFDAVDRRGGTIIGGRSD